MTLALRPEHPDVTEEMWNDIDNVINVNRFSAGAVITVLRESQDVVGYLPVEVIDYISHGLNISPSEVFGVASFYNQFRMIPPGKHPVKMCMGTACHIKGGNAIL